MYIVAPDTNQDAVDLLREDDRGKFNLHAIFVSVQVVHQARCEVQFSSAGYCAVLRACDKPNLRAQRASVAISFKNTHRKSKKSVCVILCW